MKSKRSPHKNRKWSFPVRVLLSIVIIFIFLPVIDGGFSAHAVDKAKYVIVIIGDGWSANDIEATKKYCQATSSCPAAPPYEQWTKYFMSTHTDGVGCGYDPNQAWTNFNYVKAGCITGSSAAATALFTGTKTVNPKCSVSSSGNRLVTIEERARTFGMASGAISTVELSDATPGCWVAHNDDRGNRYAIADEGFFGDPNTTGSPSTFQYGGGHGLTLPPADVIIGDARSAYVGDAIKTKLRNESGQAGKHYLVERQSGQSGGDNLIAASNDPNVTKLAGMFDFIYRQADGSGYNAENPTLSESSTATLKVLNRNPNGFVAMIEGGAIDWGAHAMNLNYVVGEMIDFNEAVQTVINWIEDPATDSDWTNTLLIVTGDHETGYLTAGPGIFPNQSLATVNNSTLALEKININTGFRASWNDQNGNNRIDSGEQVNWSWNASDHTNSLIPLYVKGAGAGLFTAYATHYDPVRGNYIDETNVFSVMNSVLSDFGAPGSVITAPVHGAIISSASPDPYTISGTASDNVAVQGIEVSTNGGSTWNAAICSGCPGENVTWSVSWSLPADGSYTIKSRATDTSGNIETPGAGNTVTIARTGPAVSSTVPTNGATGVALNSDVTINFSENMDCTTVTTSTVTISPAVGWTRKSCSGSQAVFSPSGQAETTTYNITVGTGVKNTAGNQMAGSYSFSYTTGSIQTCSGALSITPGQTLYGNPVDLTSIVTANNAVNLNYTVGKSCPAQSNVSIIARQDTWKYNGDNNGNIGTTWKDTAYNDSGWSSGSGIFGYGEPYINTLIGATGQMSMYFRKTFTICDASAVTSLRFKATYDDGMAVYINGVQVKVVGVTGNPPAWNGGAAGHESSQTYVEFNLDAYTGSLVSGTNVIAVGIYNVDTTSSDLVFDGELIVSNNASQPTLFTGNNTQAQSVNTTGWTNGVKNLVVTGDDALCLTPLTPAADTFTYRPLSFQPPVVTAFTAPSPSTSLNIPITEFTATSSWPAQSNASIIARQDTWKYNGANNGNIGTTWKNTAFNDSGWSSGSGIFGYGETYINTLIGATGQMSVYFRRPFTIYDANAVTSLRLNATYDDGMSVFINGVQVVNAGVTGNPPAWNGGAVGHESDQIYETFNLDSYIGSLVSGANVIAVGVYNNSSTSSDLVFDGELVISNVGGLTGYKITTTATPPLPGDTGWSAIAPTAYTVESDGTYTLYPWARDIAGNVSAVFATPRTVVVDTMAPEVNITVPADKATDIALNSDVTINFTENVDCTTVTNATITSSSPNWALSSCSGSQAVFHPGGQAGFTTYTVIVTTGVKDITGNHLAANIQFIYTTIDTSAPVVTAFTVPATSMSLDIPITTFTATDNAVVTGYKITNTATPPLAGDAGWTETAPATYTAESDGTFTLYPWARDAAGYVSAVFATPRTVTITMRKWTGGGVNNLASNPANWLSSIVPQNGDSVLFNGSSAKSCNWNINVSIASLNLNPGYSGVFTLNTDMSITGSLVISDGTFMTDIWNLTVGQ